MTAIHLSPWLLASFYLKKAFFFYATPALVGFLVAVLYPIGQRAASQHRGELLTATLYAALGPTFMLFGWSMVARSFWTAPFYGIGYGLGAAMLGRVHKISLWPPRLVSYKLAGAECRIRGAHRPRGSDGMCADCGRPGFEVLPSFLRSSVSGVIDEV